jgi:hypothetical protein
MIASELLADRGASEWARALLLTSVCIKLAAVPLFFWLLKLADELARPGPRRHHRRRRYGGLRRILSSQRRLPVRAHAAGALGSTSPPDLAHRRC